jgi:hypothetical protein
MRRSEGVQHGGRSEVMELQRRHGRDKETVQANGSFLRPWVFANAGPRSLDPRLISSAPNGAGFSAASSCSSASDGAGFSAGAITPLRRIRPPAIAGSFPRHFRGARVFLGGPWVLAKAGPRSLDPRLISSAPDGAGFSAVSSCSSASDGAGFSAASSCFHAPNGAGCSAVSSCL